MNEVDFFEKIHDDLISKGEIYNSKEKCIPVGVIWGGKDLFDVTPFTLLKEENKKSFKSIHIETRYGSIILYRFVDKKTVNISYPTTYSAFFGEICRTLYNGLTRGLSIRQIEFLTRYTLIKKDTISTKEYARYKTLEDWITAVQKEIKNDLY